MEFSLNISPNIIKIVSSIGFGCISVFLSFIFIIFIHKIIHGVFYRIFNFLYDASNFIDLDSFCDLVFALFVVLSIVVSIIYFHCYY